MTERQQALDIVIEDIFTKPHTRLEVSALSVALMTIVPPEEVKESLFRVRAKARAERR